MNPLAKRIYDVSVPIEPGMIMWPGQPDYNQEIFSAISRGGTSNVSLIRMTTHTGTHVDAPRHHFDGGATIDTISPELLIGRARLFQLGQSHHIDRELLLKLDLSNVSRVLFGTSNSALLQKREFEQDYAYISADGAEYLIEIGIKLVGIDYLSVEQYKKAGYPTHKTLLGAGLILIEEIDLSNVPAGDYELVCLPLKLKGDNGAPARVFLREL